MTRGTFQRQTAELKKKIKTTISDANACDGEIRELRGHQQELSAQLEDRQLNVQQLQSSADILDGDVDRLAQTKHKVRRTVECCFWNQTNGRVLS